ncbi:MAG: enoyl-CoA hydratase/isomerase family protein, partial [Bacteroidales bacterium]|nr:enoyl-CoA hydratase/isomerase family protein [Bacteroidales bacterium]
HSLNQLKIPVIAVVKGVCIGSGLELALHCHFRLCAEDAILGLPESSFGLIPGLGGISKLMELSGKAKAIELVLKGNHFNASDALKWHVVDAVYHKKVLIDKAIQLARLSADNYRKYNKSDYLQRIGIGETNVLSLD